MADRGSRIGAQEAIQTLLKCWEHLSTDVVVSAWAIYRSQPDELGSLVDEQPDV
jgi:hypothetical protein